MVPFTVSGVDKRNTRRSERARGRFARPPAPPASRWKPAAARYAPRRLHLAERVGLNIPVSTHPLAAVLAASPGCAPAFPPGFPDAPNCPAVSPQSICHYPMAETKEAGSGLYHPETPGHAAMPWYPLKSANRRSEDAGWPPGMAARDESRHGQNCPEQFWTAPALPRRGESQGGDESRRVETTAG